MNVEDIAIFVGAQFEWGVRHYEGHERPYHVDNRRKRNPNDPVLMVGGKPYEPAWYEYYDAVDYAWFKTVDEAIAAAKELAETNRLSR